MLVTYPRLASRFAAVKRSTAESTKEQANSGPDALTDEGYGTFTDLEFLCAEKFDFPFMIAVCDVDGISILVVFESDRETGFAEVCGQDERIAE